MLMLAWVIKEALYNEMEAAVAKTKIGNVTCWYKLDDLFLGLGKLCELYLFFTELDIAKFGK